MQNVISMCLPYKKIAKKMSHSCVTKKALKVFFLFSCSMSLEKAINDDNQCIDMLPRQLNEYVYPTVPKYNDIYMQEVDSDKFEEAKKR
jgi:hypothetical protein